MGFNERQHDATDDKQHDDTHDAVIASAGQQCDITNDCWSHNRSKLSEDIKEPKEFISVLFRNELSKIRPANGLDTPLY